MAPRVVRLSTVWAMLQDCAKGYTRRTTDHHHRIEYNGRIYPTLPLGKHGRRHDEEIEAAHVRKLVRFLQLGADCAKKHFPELSFSKESLQ